MDQARIGRFIAACRKEAGMTQRQLGDQLRVSDKAVSKWECGKGLPEVSLMLPLCGALRITVNDLLSGERVSGENYERRAEENMMELMRENEENKRRMTLSVICGVITIIAATSLTCLASFLDIPALARVALLALAVATAVAGIGAAAALELRAGCFECPACGETFVPTMKEYVKGYHTLVKRRLTCPKCGQTSMCRHRVVRKG